MELRVLITAEYGIHARPATKLVSQAMKYDSNITLETGGIVIDLKSIMGLMSLGIYSGTEISIRASGRDEKEAINTLEEYIVAERLGRIIK